MECVILSGATIAAVQTAINTWINNNINSGESLDIKYVSMSEGDIGTSTIKVIIFYDHQSLKAARSWECLKIMKQ